MPNLSVVAKSILEPMKEDLTIKIVSEGTVASPSETCTLVEVFNVDHQSMPVDHVVLRGDLLAGPANEECSIDAAFRASGEQIPLEDVILRGKLIGKVVAQGYMQTGYEFALSLGMRRLVEDKEVAEARRKGEKGIWIPVTLRWKHHCEEVPQGGPRWVNTQWIGHNLKLWYPVI
ncbi:hypothetical protein LIA77_08799 [Sarocladium implicatum]|nr:hypothetical protein LIA77_08799 [Sarocladium implicatum]